MACGSAVSARSADRDFRILGGSSARVRRVQRIVISASSAEPMHFRITIPRDVQLAAAVRQVAERVAQCAGFSSPEAVRVAASVAAAIDAVLTRLSPPAARSGIDLHFERVGSHLDIWVRYEAGEDNRPHAVDAALSSEALRQGMDSIEFGRDNGIAYCHLRRVLPHEKIDHQCELHRDR
jgi:hypothetical protein